MAGATATIANAPARPALSAPLWVVSAVLWGTVVLLAVANARHFGDSRLFGTVGIVFTSIAVEALPFILVGAIVSAAIETFVSDAWFGRIARLPRAVQVPGAALAGIGFPVCECGSVPVARRLLARGIDPAAGIAFMLAAPILNPIVLASTWTAYGPRGRGLEMMVARGTLGLVSAIAVGIVVARWAPGAAILSRPAPAGDAHDGHDHVDAHGHDHGAGAGRLGSFFEHVAIEFAFMGRFLILGALLAAIIQVALPQSLLTNIGGNQVVAMLVMITLAFAMSLCSESDAFVAVSFASFPLTAQLAFLVVGPALDAKLAVLYSATYRARFALLVAVVVIPLTIVGCLAFGAIL